MNETKTAVVAKINNIEIIVIKNGDDMVPIKPICEALDIDSKTQIDKIKNDEILSSTGGLCPSVGADGKDREMFSIPFKFVFGWLFTIDPARVKPEAKEAVLHYKLACYDALYEHFVGAKKFLELKETEVEKLISELKRANKNYFTAKNLKRDAESNLEKVATMTYQEYLENNGQLCIPFGIEERIDESMEQK